jgi:hypothetical protein
MNLAKNRNLSKLTSPSGNIRTPIPVQAKWEGEKIKNRGGVLDTSFQGVEEYKQIFFNPSGLLM